MTVKKSNTFLPLSNFGFKTEAQSGLEAQDIETVQI